MPSTESAAHLALKRLALTWAAAHELPLAACEVALPRSRFRADVVAVSREAWSESGAAAVFECKASRADFLHHAAPEEETRAAALALAARLDALQQLIAAHRPDLRRGEELFPTWDTYDWRGLRHDGLRRTARQLAQAQRALGSGGVKFAQMRRYRVADLFYLVTEPEVLVEPAELPVGWGWLVRDGESLVLAARPTRVASPPAARLALLERIAATATRLHAGRLSGADTPRTSAPPAPGAAPAV